MSEEIREFHLGGKQLAFLVISAIGVSVVVFLCGVMVGRGVRGLPLDDSTETASGALAAPTPATGGSDVDVPVATDGRNRKDQKQRNPIPDVEVTYPERLTAATPDAVSAPVPASRPNAAAPPTPARVTSPAAPGTREPVHGAYEVQVIALRRRASAEERRRELEAKHKPYKAVVTEAVVDGQRLFRVRVGPFATLAEARAAYERLRKDFRNPQVVPPR